MDRRRLECFVVLAEELHFGRAAARAGISQPGLSQQLRQLEEMLQVQLVARSKRQVSLTRAGEVFLDEARKIIATMAGAVELAKRTERGLVGTLKIGTTPPALYIVMPEILLRFRELYPDIDLDIRQMTTDEQFTALRAGDIHVGMLHPPVPDMSLGADLLAEQAFKVAMSPVNPLAQKPNLRLADLADETFILFPRGSSPHSYDEIIARCHRTGFSPRKIIEMAPAQSIVASAACNLGVGFVAFDVQQFRRPQVVYRGLGKDAPMLQVAAAHLREGATAAALQFTKVAQDVLLPGSTGLSAIR
jgi:DNA-binding transcriptional LysR family regulator